MPAFPDSAFPLVGLRASALYPRSLVPPRIRLCPARISPKDLLARACPSVARFPLDPNLGCQRTKASPPRLPRDRVIGLSKLPRLVDVFARRLQIQERMTQQIAQTIQDLIDPLGVGVICEARHFCMMMRGVEKQHSGAMTSAMLGAFRDRKETRDEFLALVNHRGVGL